MCENALLPPHLPKHNVWGDCHGEEARPETPRMPDLTQVRAALLEIDTAIHNLWDLGKNMVVGWTADGDGIHVALAPCYQVLGQAASTPRLLHGSRQMDGSTFRETCKVLQARVLHLATPLRIGSNPAAGEVDSEAIDSVIRRYSIVRTEHRAVILFESLGFATASPVEQMAQFVSLEQSLGAAAESMAEAGMPVELARSTAGDGALYVWNRHAGLEGDLRTYVAMILALLDNAVARAGGPGANVVPTLRTAFTIGSHYSYHQVEANRPRTFEYATGQVTISLARAAAHALPGQILVGRFERPAEASADMLDTVVFVARAERLLASLSGTSIGDQPINEIRSLISVGAVGDAARGIIKYDVEDKHGYRHEVFNLRVRAMRAGAPIELGLRLADLGSFPGRPTIYEVPGTGGDRAVEPAAG